MKSLEKEMEEYLCRSLTECGVAYDRQVICDCGVADVVTSRAVIELKINPSKSEWFKAFGQVLAYRACLHRPCAMILSNAEVPHWVLRSCKRLSIGCATQNVAILKERLRSGKK